MDLLKIQLGELEKFCESSLFQGFSTKPISPLRAVSYLKNPRARRDDNVLYLFVENNELIAFRTILPDSVVYQGETITFGWCSGTWVRPENRGQKLSVLLLNEVRKDWNDRLMFTNYASASEYCNLGTQAFHLLKERVGRRFYLYPNPNERLSPVLSAFVKGVSSFKSLFYASKSVDFVEFSDLDQECVAYLQSFPDTFFNRKECELQWIMQYHWISSSVRKDFVYPFSYFRKEYLFRIVKLYEHGEFAGFFIYTLIDSKMKIIYPFVPKAQWKLLVKAVAVLVKKHHIEYLTLLDPEMSCFFKQKANFFAFSKSYTSHIYSTLAISNEENRLIFDGDGDNCFT